MLWRFLLSAVAISYLMCVLFLSGMQKEDLDVSMLSKLQRHNVNIEDISNGELEKLCNPQDFTSTSEPRSDTEDKENISNHFNDSQMQVDQIKPEELIEEVLHKDEIQGPRLNVGIQPHTEKIIAHVIEYNKDQPNIDSVMTFWKNLAADGLKTKDYLMKPPKVSRRNEEDSIIKPPKNVHKSNFINNILNQMINLDDNDASQISESSLASKKHKDIHITNFQKSKNTKKVLDSIHYPLNGGKIVHEPYIVFKAEKENDAKTISPKQNFSDVLKIVHQYPLIQHYTEKKSPNLSNVNVQKFTSYIEPQLPIKSDTLIQQQSKQISNQFENEDFVKKIAESVKDMVMLELRKELKTTTTTTPKGATSTRTSTRKGIYIKNDDVMERFLEMFESLKSQQIQAVNSFRGNNKGSLDRNIQNNGRIVEKVLRISNPTDVMKSTPSSYDPPQIPKYKSDTPHNQHENKPHTWAKTFQTNSLEIPPLAIPITQQLNPINQNIIVTTSFPFKAIQYDSDNGIYSDGTSLKVYPKEILQSPLSAKFSKRSDDCPLHHECNHKNEDIIRFRLSNRGNSKYDTDYYEKINLGKLELNTLLNKNENGRIRKFHEKLETTDTDAHSEMDADDCCNAKYGITQEMIACCNKKIASRQQMSIANIKRGTYDDTHFQNFLKSQQKVTDMLEKILATKVKPDLPRSVETI